MKKSELLDAIRQQIRQELESLSQAAESARQAATHEENRSEDKHDTRSIEAGYLAGAQLQRVGELQGMLEFYSRLEPRAYRPDEAIGPGALVEVETEDGKRSRFFIAAQAGGMVVRVGTASVQIITPKSPVGDELVGRKKGETFEVEQRGVSRELTVLSVE